MMKDAGINVGANYIFGLGHDTWDSMQETLNLALELNAENANMYCATALPGSPLYLKAKMEGWKFPDSYDGYGFLAYNHLPSRTYSLTSEEVSPTKPFSVLLTPTSITTAPGFTIDEVIVSG